MYRLPDDKLAQDSVSAFFVFAGRLWHMGLAEEIMGEKREEGDDEGKGADKCDCHSRTKGLEGRYARSGTRIR